MLLRYALYLKINNSNMLLYHWVANSEILYLKLFRSQLCSLLGCLLPLRHHARSCACSVRLFPCLFVRLFTRLAVPSLVRLHVRSLVGLPVRLPVNCQQCRLFSRHLRPAAIYTPAVDCRCFQVNRVLMSYSLQ